MCVIDGVVLGLDGVGFVPSLPNFVTLLARLALPISATPSLGVNGPTLWVDDVRAGVVGVISLSDVALTNTLVLVGVTRSGFRSKNRSLSTS